MKRAEILQYYDDERNRLMKLWSDKSGMPIFLTRKNRNFLYMGAGAEEIELDNETMENISEKLKLILKKARRREIFSVIK